jgi:hypothetical protein
MGTQFTEVEVPEMERVGPHETVRVLSCTQRRAVKLPAFVKPEKST